MPGSPVPGRKAEPDISVPGIPTTRPGSGGRRKLGSRHGWGIGLARGGSGFSQSFSPGDHKTPLLLRLRSAQNTQMVVWEGGSADENTPRAADMSLESSFDEGEGKSHARVICLGLLKEHQNQSSRFHFWCNTNQICSTIFFLIKDPWDSNSPYFSSFQTIQTPVLLCNSQRPKHSRLSDKTFLSVLLANSFIHLTVGLVYIYIYI